MCCIEYTPTVWDVFSGSATYGGAAQSAQAGGVTCVVPTSAMQIDTDNKCASAEESYKTSINYVSNMYIRDCNL